MAKMISIICLIFISVGCSPTHQTRSVETSGFLGDYSQLKEGGSDEALLIYRRPNVDFKKYKKVMIKPITIWRAKNSDLEDLPQQEAQHLSDVLYTNVHNELKKDYEIVEEPGEDVMVIRLAITEASKSMLFLDTATTIIPQLRAASTILGRLAVGTHAFVGRASLEGEILDSSSKERIFAGVDRQAGRKNISGLFQRWDDVEDAFKHWAQKIRKRLAKERGEKITE